MKFDGYKIHEIMIFKISGEVLLRTVGSDLDYVAINTNNATNSVMICYRNKSTQWFYNVTVMITEEKDLPETRQMINV